MRNAGKFFWVVFFVWAFCAGSSIVFGAGGRAQSLNLPDLAANAVADDTDVPDVTARVARISFIRGDVRIRRIGGTDWEKAGLNLPIVEGDELTTGGGARLEIQFNNFSHLRLDQDSFLRIAVLKTVGVAVGISQGTMSLRVTDLGKARGYFEIDAPKTTIAVQAAGTYRIDAGKLGDTDIRLGITNGGEARVYSDSAGFTLKNGRSARVFVVGDNAGEWETADAARYSDEFESWVADRDSVIARSIRAAYYDKYYDQDIYGADDLGDYGEWIHTSRYGHVWRPYKNSINTYANWSPYRYGHWRWIPPYGWTWVNDEPWGWATYHHGRWIYDNGYWAWTPYGYYRSSRSWWFPALVVINIINDNVCWYPLQYNHRYTNFNNRHGDHGRDRDRDQHVGRVRPTPLGTPIHLSGDITPTPTRTPPSISGDRDNVSKRQEMPLDDEISDRVPPSGVVTEKSADFGTQLRGARTATPAIANLVLAKLPAREQGADLPEYEKVSGRIKGEIIADRPSGDDAARQTKVGADVRRPDVPLDRELRTTRIFGGRPPAKLDNAGDDIESGDRGVRETRKVGAVDRSPVRNGDDVDKAIKDRRIEPPEREAKPKTDPPNKQPPGFDSPPREMKDQNETPPAKRPPGYDSPPRENREPTETPPAKRPPGYDSPPREVKEPAENPPVRQPPRREPPQREEKPRSETPPAKQPPRYEPPQREEKPRNEPPPPRNDPPPPRNEPKDNGKPSNRSETRDKDGK